MEPVKTIEKILLTSPLSIENRLRAIDQLLFVNGNGFDWVNGELCGSDTNKIETPADAVLNILHRSLMGDHNYMIDMYRSNGLEHIYYKNIIRQVEDVFNTEKRMNDMSDPDDDYQFYTLCRHSSICNIPDDITPEWLELIDEVLKLINERPYLLDDPENLFPGVIERFYKIKSKQIG